MLKKAIDVIGIVGVLIGMAGATSADFQEVTHVYDYYPEAMMIAGILLALPMLGVWYFEEADM